MGRATIVIDSKDNRARATRWLAQAPYGTRVQFQGPRRSIPQNDLMWAHLSDIASQVVWYGSRLTPDDWKIIFLDALNRELRVVPNVGGTGYVNLGRSSSDLSKEEMSDLILLIEAFASERNVILYREEKVA